VVIEFLRGIDPRMLEVVYLTVLGLATVTIFSISAFVIVALFRGQR
jgi:hypothetical protein